MKPTDSPTQVAIVTGAASGIGAALSRQLAEHGWRVALLDVDATRLDDVAKSIRSRDGSSPTYVCDVSREDSVCQTFGRIGEELGCADRVFNCAGLEINGEVLEVDARHWQVGFEVDVTGTLLISRAAYALMRQRGSGHLVNVASLAGLVPLPGLAYYSAAKHAVVAFSLALRMEARHYGIRVSVACPALVDTAIRTNTAAYLGRAIDVAPRLRWPRPSTADRCARAILRGVDRNAAVILAPASAVWLWWLYRWSPGLYAATASTLYTRAPIFAKAVVKADPWTGHDPPDLRD